MVLSPRDGDVGDGPVDVEGARPRPGRAGRGRWTRTHLARLPAPTRPSEMRSSRITRAASYDRRLGATVTGARLIRLRTGVAIRVAWLSERLACGMVVMVGLLAFGLLHPSASCDRLTRRGEEEAFAEVILARKIHRGRRMWPNPSKRLRIRGLTPIGAVSGSPLSSCTQAPGPSPSTATPDHGQKSNNLARALARRSFHPSIRRRTPAGRISPSSCKHQGFGERAGAPNPGPNRLKKSVALAS